VSLFALVYLSTVIRLDEPTVGLMYGVLIVMSVPMPLVAGWLSDRLGRKPLIVGVYLGGAIGFALFMLAGPSVAGLWLGILVMGLFSFAESPQLQALLADIAPPGIRDASFALYFTLAFGIGSMWIALYGWVIQMAGEPAGIPIVFWLMAGTFILAALSVLPVRAGRRGDAAVPNHL
jgi:MFS family permease